MAPVIKRKTVITWESPKRVQLEFEHVAYAQIAPNSDNIIVVVMDEKLYPDNAFIYSADGKILYTAETTADLLFYDGVGCTDKNIYLYCQKLIEWSPGDFFQMSHINMVDGKGKIISSVMY